MTLKSERRLVSSACAALAIWPVLLFVLYSVFIRIQSKYFAALLASSGIDGDHSPVNVLFLYRQDLLLLGALLPLAALASFYWLRTRVAVILWSALIVAAQVLLYSNLQSWGQVGRFLTSPALANAISFGLSNPKFIADYISVDGLVKLVVLLIGSGLVLLAVTRLRPDSRWLRAGGWVAIGGIVASFALAAYGWTSRMQPVPITGSFLIGAVDALIGQEGEDVPDVPDRELNARFKALALSEAADFRGPNFGVETGSNLLLFVMETGSIEFLDIRNGLPAHPVLEKLKARLFLAKNHYSTFPASAESNLSILAGIYPPRAIYDTCLTDAASDTRTIPGFVPVLRQRGYETALYAPYKSQVPADRLVFEHTGFARTFYGNDHKTDKQQGADARTLKELSDDITGWTAKGQRFAAAFFPQIGHGPWSADLGRTIKDRGHKLAMEQLDWLDGIVKQLEKTGQLERTVIVITGDHGVRTALEDERVRVGMIDQYSLHVPLLVYAPHADYAAVDPALPSSHVDLAAEMTQLFGVPRNVAQQGLAFHDPARTSRRQFFVAGWYYGADGYRDTTEAAMFSTTLGATYIRKDGRVDFRSDNLVRDRKEAARVDATVKAMLDLQESWIRHRVCTGS